jgi:Alpha/beta hydrolase family
MSKFVLIPGAGGAAWYWHRVVPLLEQAGHSAIAVDLPADDPATGLSEYASLVAQAASADGDSAGDDVVLVALSLGGFTAPIAAGMLPAGQVSSLVLVNAMIPVPGETPGQWWDNTGWEQAKNEAAEAGGYGTDFDENAYFLHDVPPEVLADAEPSKPEADIVFASPCEFEAWPPIPIRVAAGAGDRFFPAEFQRRVALDRLGIEADIIPGGHLIALAEPEALTAYLTRRGSGPGGGPAAEPVG